MTKHKAERAALEIVRDLSQTYGGGFALLGESLMMAMCEARLLQAILRCEYGDGDQPAGTLVSDVIAVRRALLDRIYPQDAEKRKALE